jgi:hypothetical protein
MKKFITMLSEAAEESALSDLLGQIWDDYVEETGDEEGESYDVGLGILTTYADEIPSAVANKIAEDLAEIFGFDESEDDEEDMDEGLKIVKKKKKTSAEKMKAHKEYMGDKSKLKIQAKKWRKSAAGKKWAAKYSKFKQTHKIKKGQRISTT